MAHTCCRLPWIPLGENGHTERTESDLEEERPAYLLLVIEV